jgi:hypothetical protein
MDYQNFDYDFYEHDEHVEYIKINHHKEVSKEVTKDITIPVTDKEKKESDVKTGVVPTSMESGLDAKKIKVDYRFSNPIVGINKLQLFDKGDSSLNLSQKQAVMESLSIYAVTWNLYGKSATPNDIKALLPEQKYDMYVIGSEECMRSIFKSFFFSDKSHWEKMIM